MMDNNKIQAHLNNIYQLLNNTEVKGAQNMANIVNALNSAKAIQSILEESENEKEFDDKEE